MTQIGGIDVLVAWCAFAVILLVLGGFIGRGHRDVRRLSREDLDRAEESRPPGNG